MRKNNSIPIIFGVTGHRDLRDEDVSKLEESVRKLFNSFKEKYLHTELIVLTALAEGADILVGRVAKELGLTIHVVLPYEEEAYLQSFDDPSNPTEFKELLDYSSKEPLINASIETCTTSECYQKLGEYIADKCNILIALWDGSDNGKRGGTSAIVRYTKEGFKQNRFDQLDGNALLIITTPRLSNPDVKTDFSVVLKCLSSHMGEKEFGQMLTKIDNINQKFNIHQLKDGSLLKTYTKLFDGIARRSRDQFKHSSLLILFLSFVALGSLEAMHVLRIDILVVPYIVALLFAFWWYKNKMKDGKVQDDFVYSRGFAEALRVQNVWNYAKVERSVAGSYLKNYNHKFAWMHFILKNLTYLDKEPYDPYSEKFSIETWIDGVNGQIGFFEDRIETKEKLLKKWETREKHLYIIGEKILWIMGTLALMQILFFPDTKWLQSTWHILVLVSGLSLLAAAIIGEKYLKIEGYQEEIYNYEISLSSFKAAKKRLAKVEKDSKEYKAIVEDLGMKALEENSKWVVLRDSVRAKPSLD